MVRAEKIRTSLDWVLQPLIEAELTATIAAGPHERTETRSAQRNGHRPKLITTAAGDVELYIPSCGRGASIRRCWSAAGVSTGLCSRWSWRPGCTGCPPARWTTW